MKKFAKILQLTLLVSTSLLGDWAIPPSGYRGVSEPCCEQQGGYYYIPAGHIPVYYGYGVWGSYPSPYYNPGWIYGL